ncbi:MAG: aminoacyl-tRNA hydrolase [Candidatus Levybacteria bacterium]|nr:aminoacyl-tRNA hydrolase [Candidatus Levybacteria bacterium]
MKLIIGLGNPGERYEKTRHNAGFLVVEQFLKDFDPVKETAWIVEDKLKSDIAKIEWKPKVGPAIPVILAKPKTYMNNSGMAVSLIASFYKISPSDIWVIHDEFDFPLGSMKIRFGGASAGHKGVDSVITALGTDKFWRFRIGIGNAKKIGGERVKISTSRHIDDYVLDGFAPGEWGTMRKVIKRASKAIQASLEESLEKAMNQFNTK